MGPGAEHCFQFHVAGPRCLSAPWLFQPVSCSCPLAGSAGIGGAGAPVALARWLFQLASAVLVPQ